MKKMHIGLADKLLIIFKEKEGYSFSTHLTGKKINQLAFDPENEKYIYAGTNDGLWQTKDGGTHWERIAKNLPTSITSIAIHPLKGKNMKHAIYVGTEPTQLYYSFDRGQSWEEFKGIQDLPSKSTWRFPPRPETHYARWITPSYHDANQLALSIEAGAVISTNDQGENWQDRSDISPIDVHTLLAHPQKLNRLYAANGDGSSSVRKAYAESEDWGKTWTFKSEGLKDHPYLYHLILNSQDPEERLVSASKNASAAHRSPRYSTIYRKRGEEEWTEMKDGLPRKGAYTHHLAEDPDNPGAYYALNNYGIYYLSSKENQWEQLSIDEKEMGFNQRAYYFTVR
ncbi:MAG: hypothetical protein L0L39_02505 [Atopostipes suicloacalis]|nr:hypothetical protein [Atopostipes suicloacalis]